MPTIPYKNTKGKRVKGVTTYISRQCAWGKDGLMYWQWKEGAEGRNFNERSDRLANSGTVVHDRVEAHMLGKPWKGLEEWEALDEENTEIANMSWESFLNWFKMYKPVTLATEQPLVSELYQFGGCPDWIGTIGEGTLTIIDWKRSVYSNYVVQVGAYRQLWNEKHPDKIVDQAEILKLGKESASFIHLHFNKMDLELGFRAFRGFQILDEIEGKLKKLV